MININSGNGTLGRLIKDSTIAENINQTVNNLKKSSKGLDENMNAAKENFLFKGYYKRKEKEAEKIKVDSAEKRKMNKKRLIRRKNDYPDIKFSKMEMQICLKKYFHALYYFIFISGFASAQETQAKKDSTTIYKNIESILKQSKFRTFIYRLIFKPAHGTKKKEVRKKRIKN